jgi:nucleoid-associated protein YgaU
VRVKPSGESVIAGRGAPGETIALVDGDASLASAVADARGEVVFLPPALPPGKHVLMLRATGTVPASASQSVAVVVPTKGGDAPGVTAVTSLPPARLSTIQPDIATPKAAAPTIAVATPPTKVAPAIAIKSVEAEDGGSFVATGLAPPGSQTRLYLNGAFLAKVMADVSGSWALKIEKGMQPGSYRVRADGVEPASGKVLARAEVPFVFPVPSPPALPLAPLSAAEEGQPPSRSPLSSQELAAKEAPAVAATVLKEVRTATVVRGDSLWRISHKMLGRGIRYKQIYEANESQIRDPSLVFPGQIFVMPSNPN